MGRDGGDGSGGMVGCGANSSRLVRRHLFLIPFKFLDRQKRKAKKTKAVNYTKTQDNPLPNTSFLTNFQPHRDRDWQKWPITIVTGAYLGWFIGRLAGGYLLRGKRIEFD